MGLAAGVGAGWCCGLDSDRAAPPLPLPPSEGPCRSTPDLIPKLLAFVRDDRMAPVKAVIERRFLPTPSVPDPEPSLRSIAAAGLRVVAALGLEETGLLAEVAASEEVEVGLGPLVSRFLRFVDGRVDGRPHYDASDAAAWFVQRCDPDFLLTGIERLLRLQSRSEGRPWVVAVIEAFAELASDPAAAPFLTSFERLGDEGRPAVVSLLEQVMVLVADPEFEPERLDTLLESAVYPLVEPALEARIGRLLTLLKEATAPSAGVLGPLQGALRCGLMHPGPRNVLLGTIYDLLIAPASAGPSGLEGLEVLRRPVVAEQLDLLADAVFVVRRDLDGRDDLRAAAVVLLSTPDVQLLVPVSIALVDEGVAAEVVEALARLLITCAEGT